MKPGKAEKLRTLFPDCFKEYRKEEDISNARDRRDYENRP